MTMNAPRNPWIALALSLAATGAGHIYCGRVVRGATLFASWFAVLVAAFLASRTVPSTAILVALLVVPSLVVFGVYLFACLDAWRLARGSSAEYELRDYNHGGLYALLVVIGGFYPFLVIEAVRTHYFEAYVLAGGSMEPALDTGDRVLVNKARGGRSERGDIVAFDSPEDAGLAWIKRVVGLPGDRVEIRDGRCAVNGTLQELGGRAAEDLDEFTVPAGHVFVLGENLENSKDSRHFGPLPEDRIRGRVEYVFLPGGDWSRFGEL